MTRCRPAIERLSAVRQPDPAPNRRMNLPQKDLQLQQQGRACIDHHPDHSLPRPAIALGMGWALCTARPCRSGRLMAVFSELDHDNRGTSGYRHARSYHRL